MTAPQGALGPPRRDTIQGRAIRLEPLDEERHGAQLWAAVEGQDQLWTYMGYGPWPNETAFRAWVAERAKLDDPLSFAVVNQASGEAVGVVTLMRIDAPNGCVETGHIFFSPRLQKTPGASEAIYLLARTVFDDLKYRRFEWKCDNGNAASQAAAKRFGFSYEGLFRQHMIIKGRNRDTAWFAMLDHEWPTRKAAFERWLAPGNFDADGKQTKSLTDHRRDVETELAG
jgi:RimJ/RimL family protein N-acetyltransferase